MSKALLRDAVGWGALLWLIGYLLGLLFFFLVPPAVLGWAVMPIGAAVTLWVLIRKVTGPSFAHYVVVAAVWTMLAVVLDYVFIVKLLNAAHGYYKTDVYIYYALTFLMPLAVGWWKTRARATA